MAAAPEFADVGVEASAGSDAEVALVGARQPRSWAKVVAASAGALLLAACAGAGAARLNLRGGSSSDAEKVTQLPMIVAQPGPDQCADQQDDCLSVGCCKVSGFTCFETKDGKGQCMKGCIPGVDGSCKVPQKVMDPILVDADPIPMSLYCFSTYMSERGTTKKIVDELGNLQLQYRRKIGIFLCEQWQVFTEGDAELAPGVPFYKVFDEDNDFHFAKRKSFGTWINTGFHTQVWKAILKEGRYPSADWVVKLDADAVFVHSRLVPMLQKYSVPDDGIYLENCQYVDYGYFGNLEVFSRQAFITLANNIDKCKGDLPWKIGVEGGKWGPMGEDLFAQQCLDLHGVRRVQAYDISTDGACEADRPEGEKKNKKFHPDCSQTCTPQMHPYFTPDLFEACYDATVAACGGE